MKSCLSLLFSLICAAAGAQGIAVVELFTSQGCSSCPAADKNLTEMLNHAATDGQQVIGLSFHVDYWNSLGWKDPYSDKAFTARQRRYAQQLNLNTMYTPQMIINGQYEFVGSDKAKAEETTKRVLDQKPVYRVAISSSSITDHRLSVHYTLDKAPHGETLNLAIVEKDVENVVPRGENAGKKLHHDNVVRSFITVPVEREGDIEVVLPDVRKAAIVLYIQDDEWHVTGATVKNLQVTN